MSHYFTNTRSNDCWSFKSPLQFLQNTSAMAAPYPHLSGYQTSTAESDKDRDHTNIKATWIIIISASASTLVILHPYRHQMRTKRDIILSASIVMKVP